MIQFTQTELETIRERSRRYPETIRNLKESVREVYQGEILVPQTGIANWTHYYYCPDCSVRLEFDREEPHRHRCPVCGRVFSGEPYDSAWWGMINAQNSRAVRELAVIWLITGDESFARKAKDILLTYARYYPEYQPHGDIPYNGPGRVGAQTLDEANFQRDMVMAVDLLSDFLSQEELGIIRDRMLMPAAEFLMEHRVRQVHNHEIFVNSAIAMIGILFDRKDLIHAAMDEKYGLLYLLEHGVQKNGMWFEGSFGYHFYALEGFLQLEKMALHTPYSHLDHPSYRKMLNILADYLEPDGSVPMLNDTNYGHLGTMKLLYEFPYRELGGERLAYILNTYYRDHRRDNEEALLYGAENIEKTGLAPVTFHTPVGESGYTIFRSEDQYLLFKHDTYGGEHDHYDRLDLSYLACGKPVSRDLGTTGYGAALHYGYYKNSGTHNTLVIGEENQAPVQSVLTHFSQSEDGTLFAAAEADWTKPYRMPDSFVIRQWSEINYKNVRLTRKIAFRPRYFIELMEAEGIPENETADWMWHFSGKLITADPGEALPADYFVKKPLNCLTDARAVVLQEDGGTWNFEYQDGDVRTVIFGTDADMVRITAKGPDNPSSGKISFLMERRCGVSRFVTAHVIGSWRVGQDMPVRDVRFGKEQEKTMVSVLEADGTRRKIVFDF
ncbi:MAG: heparinase II/III family protein [Lachnospiraceae bacterium]|jgi:rubredoxin|nr:heparinase II/III family protein [Lachnospiraceae bacterium]MCH4031993.1 heparinase II/III family protein [Lachnospiraceae bacterium]MCH4070612.1 heparinase II/III family protein [Lachnospiraceae bacterium]MCH4109284.1 heparinase II/III family protein [Lachnospiraceae bacterium]MCI1302929.1 heparinase II/III family protein [Lachnospiraceae bacterium]